MIHVLATIRVNPAHRNDFLDQFRRLTPLVRAEAGCIEYGAATDIANALEGQPAARTDIVTVVEKWDDVPALQRHLAAPHMLRFRDAVKDLVTGIEIRVLNPV